MHLRKFAPLVLALVIGGCATVHKMGVKSVGGIFPRASIEFEKQTNFELMRNGLPGNLP